MTWYRVTLHFGVADVEAAPITIINTDARSFPSVDLAEMFHLMPGPEDDLSEALRRLADRIDIAMASTTSSAAEEVA
jgi:hypothetical protein